MVVSASIYKVYIYSSIISLCYILRLVFKILNFLNFVLYNYYKAPFYHILCIQMWFEYSYYHNMNCISVSFYFFVHVFVLHDGECLRGVWGDWSCVCGGGGVIWCCVSLEVACLCLVVLYRTLLDGG